jgi:hypothetical protein
VTEFQWLEALLRKEGFLVGPLSRDDEEALDAILKAIRERFSK